MKKLINEYVASTEKTTKAGIELAKLLKKKLKLVIPDIDIWLQWGNKIDGMETEAINYCSDSHGKIPQEKFVILEDAILKVYPQLKGHLSAFSEVFLTFPEKEEIIKLLQEVKDERD